jgi:hypothetical protein
LEDIIKSHDNFNLAIDDTKMAIPETSMTRCLLEPGNMSRHHHLDANQSLAVPSGAYISLPRPIFYTVQVSINGHQAGPVYVDDPIVGATPYLKNGTNSILIKQPVRCAIDFFLSITLSELTV